MAFAASCSSTIAGRVALATVGLLLIAIVTSVASWPASAQAPSSVELVMFEEAGCPWCRLWDREVAGAYARSDEGRRAPLRRIHIAEARRSGLALKAPVTVTPTFVLVAQGAEVGRITGYPGADFFWGMLGELMARLPNAPAGNRARDARIELFDSPEHSSRARGSVPPPQSPVALNTGDRLAGGERRE